MKSIPNSLQAFLAKYTIEELSEADIQVIDALQKAYVVYEDVIDGTTSDISKETWGITVMMLQIMYKYASSALILALSEQNAAAEIVSRTVVESAINLMYVLHSDTNQRVAYYIADYYYREMDELNRWEKDTKQLNDEQGRNIYLMTIVRKRYILNTLPNMFSQIAGVSFPSKKQWKKQKISIAKKFASLGREIEYRTVYAALCTQVHNAPEDLINNMLVNAISNLTGSDHYANALQIEESDFAKTMALRAIGYYLESMIEFLNHYNHEVNATEVKGYYEIISRINNEGATETLLNQWGDAELNAKLNLDDVLDDGDA